jgi:hypothetical protein
VNAPFKVKLLGAPVWKAKIVPYFPANVNALSPITLTQTGGGINQTIGLDLPSLLDALTARINIEFIIDAGGSVITTGVKGDIEVSFGGTILSWTLLADQTGDIAIDIWKDSYGNYPPTAGDSITAGTPPSMSSAIKQQSSNLLGWNQTIIPGSIYRFNVNSVSAIRRATLSLTCLKDWSV